MIFHSYVSLPEGNIDLQMDQLRFLANQKLDAKRKTQQGFGVEIASLGPTNTGAVEKRGSGIFPDPVPRCPKILPESNMFHAFYPGI